jgi:hypothetical protein
VEALTWRFEEVQASVCFHGMTPGEGPRERFLSQTVETGLRCSDFKGFQRREQVATGPEGIGHEQKDVTSFV